MCAILPRFAKCNSPFTKKLSRQCLDQNILFIFKVSLEIIFPYSVLGTSGRTSFPSFLTLVFNVLLTRLERMRLRLTLIRASYINMKKYWSKVVWTKFLSNLNYSAYPAFSKNYKNTLKKMFSCWPTNWSFMQSHRISNPDTSTIGQMKAEFPLRFQGWITPLDPNQGRNLFLQLSVSRAFKSDPDCRFKLTLKKGC